LEDSKELEIFENDIQMPSYSGRPFHAGPGISDCSVCLTLFKNGDKVVLLECNEKHVFHLKCINTWAINLKMER